MIPRYSRPEMVEIWQPTNKFKIWLEIEILACEAQEELGVIPKGVSAKIREKADFNIEKIDQIEEVTKHDVIAFLTNVAEYVGEESRFIHQGMTSSDVLDTCLNLQLKQASDLLVTSLEDILSVLKKRALECKDMICIGRSHGIHAEPTTMGIKFARFYAEMERNLQRLKTAREEISTCALSGAVGTFANIDPYVEEYVAKQLGVKAEPVSTQIIPRDRHAAFFATLGVIASSIENIAIEVRHLQRTEVLEAEEYFSKGQKGSSAMPHKRNPVLSENLTGLARYVRSAVIPALENVASWHERDISHSSVERMVAPDTTVVLHFALFRLKSLLENLVVYPENMLNNLNSLKGLVFSQRVLLTLTQKGMSREDAYALVQKNAMQVWAERVEFKDLLKNSDDVKKYLTTEELDEIFDLNYHTKNIDVIFKRVFG